MAVTVTDTRTIIDEADATGTSPTTPFWTGPSITAGTAVFAEAPNSIIGTLNIATGQCYVTISPSVDVSNSLIYVWSNNYALQDVWDATNPPNALHLGDGTDRWSFKMAGSNRKVFAHLDSGTGTRVDWDYLVLDGSQASAMNSAGLTVFRAGSGTFSDLNLTSITQFGSDFTTLSKGLGGGTNVAVDIIRVGNDGLIITGGTTGERGTFLQIVNEDKSTADKKALGIIREYTTGLYGLQGPLTFGDGISTGTGWFQDSNAVLVFENRNISNDKYYLKAAGNATGETHFILANSTITTAGPYVACYFNGTNINELSITNSAFRGLGNAISFGTDTSAQSHTVTGNTFDTCSQIDPGKVIFQNNTISSTTDANGGLLIDADGTSNMSDLSFVSGGTGHAIYITATGTYDFTNFTYSGYGADGTTNAVVYNNSGGAVTINVTGGDTPTVRNGAGASTTINNAVTLEVNGVKTGTEPTNYVRCRIEARLGGSLPVGTQIMNEEANQGPDSEDNYYATEQFNYTTDQPVTIRVRYKGYIPFETTGTITSNGLTVTAVWLADPNYVS